MLSVRRVRGRRSVFALAVLLGGVPLLGGCGEQGPKKENVGEVVEAQRRAERVRAQAEVQAINTALQEYYAQNRRFPDRLEALPFIQDRRIDTSWYVYDAASGQVRLRDER